MRFSVLRFVSYFFIALFDRSLWRRWQSLSPRRQYYAQVLILLVLLGLLGVGAYNQNLLILLGFYGEVVGLLIFLTTCWRWSPILLTKLRQKKLLTLALLAVNVIALFKMPNGQRSLSMATSSLAIFVLYMLVSKLGGYCRGVCCVCFNCCREVFSDAGDLPNLQ
jgi:hypothetical protein